MVSERFAQRPVGAGGDSYYQDREQQGCCARAPQGWVHGRVLIVTIPTSALPPKVKLETDATNLAMPQFERGSSGLANYLRR